MTGRVSIVLLIEHDALQRGTLTRLLKTAGYCVIPTGRAHEALETFSTHHVDIALVVVDTGTTTSGGPPLLESLATIDPHVPVVALSPGVANERPAYEYPNVAAILLRPFEPADVLVSVERVLLPVSQRAPTPVAPVTGRDAAFNWPPTEEDLDDVQVVDTKDWRVPAEPRAVAAAEPDLPVIWTTPAAITDLVPVEPPSRSRLVTPGLVTRGLERRRWSYGDRLSPRTRRALTVAATTLCGLALTTLLELRSTPAELPALEGETVREVASAPLLAANHHSVDVMPLASARRVTSRPVANVAGRETALRARPVTSTSTESTESTESSRSNRLSRSRVSSSETRATMAKALRPARVAPVAPPPAAAPSPASAAPVEAATETAAHDAGTSATSARTATIALTRSGADERDIYQVLQRYERAYERLDVNAARAIWPSLDARKLARAFDGLKAQRLEFSHCRVALDLAEAIAICGGRASYVPRVGRQAARTEPREWTFRLRKVDHDWLIAKAEVR